MNNSLPGNLSRRDILRLSAAGAATVAAQALLPSLANAAPTANLYATTLRTWCDGLLAHQLTMPDQAFYGALLCPACGLIHGRCADAMYPMMHLAHTTGDQKYLRSAIALHNWSQRTVSQSDGSWINDLTLSSWQGITVFHTIALAESIHHHGAILDTGTRTAWTARLAAAAKFLDGFISIQTGNINYPITASYAFALCGQVLAEPRYTDRARKLAHAALDFFTPNGLIFGEGHPLEDVTAKGCRAVDLGYNIEESLPALAQYAVLTGDQQVLDRVVTSLRAHLEFLLPNGAWDNSWGTRNYKWSYWGSRTSDGCQPAFVLLADHDPRFREAALRNLQLMSACTHDSLLYGGPDYFAHGDRPCIHHTFTHAKALATVLDSKASTIPTAPAAIPRDLPYPVKHLPEIGTYLASAGPWRATVTENDWDYGERVQSNGGGELGGGHATGGALSQLYHQTLGQILVASMTEYSLIEISNQQVHLDKPHMPLTPRIELVAGTTYTSLSDLTAKLTASPAGNDTTFEASGQILTAKHHPVPGSSASYQLQYTIASTGVTITALASGSLPSNATLQLILPVVSPSAEPISQPDSNTIRITKSKGTLTLRSDAPHAFAPIPKQRTFNLVPGLECIPIAITLQPGQPISVAFKATT